MSLVLDSLEIKNFRAFKHLRIEKLGRVNLIVGKNNVGKSSLLEALWLYAVKGDPTIVMQLLKKRNELKVTQDGQFPDSSASNEHLLALRYLFHGRKNLLVENDQISIGSSSTERDRITIGFGQSEWVDSGHGYTVLRLVGPNEEPSTVSLVPGLTVNVDGQVHMLFPLDQNYPSSRTMYRPERVMQVVVRSVIVSDEGLTAKDAALYWDNIALSDSAQDVIFAMRVITPELIALNFAGDKSRNGERIPEVRVAGVDNPIPLSNMGEGMNRMLGIALALVNAKDGMLLIDEVDTGLHYSVLPDLWKLIFEVAHRLNVQVFATSHSWDCIQAFQLAAEENKEEEGIVIRLETQDGEIVSVPFDERKLNIAIREHIEVR